jgi:uncharacterized protein YprB with RNaseH-like and TPR domain
MLYNIKLKDVLFLDIETVPQNEKYDDLSDKLKKLWDRKAEKLISENETPENIYNRAGIYAEFGKIICISTGYIHTENNERTFRLKSFYSQNETELLSEFAEMLNTHFNKQNFYLCAHNGKEFDYPYISRRMLLNSIKLPKILNISGLKPWEIKHLDTLEMWKFGDYKSYTSLDLLTTIFNIPTPKDDIDGSLVYKVFYEENNLNRIVKYCEKDVLAITQLLLKYRNEPILNDNEIVSVTKF